MIEVHIHGEIWYLIEFPHQFVKRWLKAKRRNRFMFVAYAGRRMWVNPNQIQYAMYKSEL